MSPSRREKFWPALRHGTTITIVAALIWLFAEAQSVSERAIDVRITISAPSGGGLIVVANDPTWTGRASVRLQGARAAIDTAVRQLADGVTLLVGAPGVSSAIGRQVVDLRSAIISNPPLDRADVTIALVEPRTLELRVDELVRLEGVAVRAEIPGVQTVGDIVIEPVEATIVLPSAARDALGAGATALSLTARPTQASLQTISEGRPKRLEARLSLPAELANVIGARIEPQTVMLSFTVRSTTESLTLPSVPVWPMAPPIEIARWDIAVEPMLLRDVELTGSSDELERIRSGELRILATVQLSSDDLEQRITSKTPIIFGLSDSVRVVSTIAPVRLTITPRSAAPSSTEPDQE